MKHVEVNRAENTAPAKQPVSEFAAEDEDYRVVKTMNIRSIKKKLKAAGVEDVGTMTEKEATELYEKKFGETKGK